GADFELAGIGRHGEVGDEGVFGFAGAGRNDGKPTGFLSAPDSLEGFGDGADLVEFDQHGIGGLSFDATLDPAEIGGEMIVADQLATMTDGLSQFDPTVPIVLGEGVFD